MYEIDIWGCMTASYLRQEKIPTTCETAEGALRALDQWLEVMDEYNVRAAHPITIYRNGRPISISELEERSAERAD